MPKIRKLASIESGLSEVIRILSEEEIEKAIGKSVSYLRKCSDPDQPQQIDHKHSLRLDLECIKKHKAPPLLNSHEYFLSSNAADYKVLDDDLDSILLRFTILHGKLTEIINNAQDPQSDKGEKISSAEKQDIFEAVKNVEDKLTKIKKVIDQKI